MAGYETSLTLVLEKLRDDKTTLENIKEFVELNLKNRKKMEKQIEK